MPRNNHGLVKYYPVIKKVKIYAKTSEVYPNYVEYLLKSLRIPTDVTLEFQDKTIKGGIEAWRKE